MNTTEKFLILFITFGFLIFFTYLLIHKNDMKTTPNTLLPGVKTTPTTLLPG